MSFNNRTRNIPSCSDAEFNLFGRSDTCSTAVLGYLNNNESVISDILTDNCPIRLCEYVSDCNENDRTPRVSEQSV